jgi:diguanylate cyclase (GGDEF)-like protein
MVASNDNTIRNLEDFSGIASDWFWETDAEHRFTYFSNRIEEVTKVPAHVYIGRRRDSIPTDEQGDPKWVQHMADLRAHRPFQNLEYTISRGPDQPPLWIRSSGQPIFHADGTFLGYRGSACDATDEIEATKHLEQAYVDLEERNIELDEARHRLEQTVYEDALTGLLNRRAFERDLPACLATPSANVALLHVDLDRFKWVNDTLGHPAGDAVLICAARRIACVVGDTGTVYRVGGDEFLIIVDLHPLANSADWISDSIIEAMNPPIHHGQQRATVGASIGIAHCDAGHTAAGLVADADTALYEAKRGGRNRVCKITPCMQARIQARRRLATDIPRALERGEFIPYYQPQVHVGTGAVVGAEALVRWQHPEMGLLSPASFLDLAAELGLVSDIDRCVLVQALGAATRLMQQGLVLPCISTNVSAARLMDPSLPDDVNRLWTDRRYRLSIELLETIDFDESSDSTLFNDNLTKLRDMGVRIETDDFGSGRASITGLLKVWPDRLKIDRGLIQAAVNDRVKRSVVSAIFDMTRSLGIEAMAEGVETQEDIDTIKGLGCHIVQGYALSRPLSEENLAVFLASRHIGPETQTAGPKDLPKTA